MNSVYKTYFKITLVTLAIVCGIIGYRGLNQMREIDAVNAYAIEHGSVEGYEFNLMGYSSVIKAVGESEVDVKVPMYPYTEGCEDDATSLWPVVGVILTALLYNRERSSVTGDFSTLLPVRSRSKLLAKALCLGVVALGIFLMGLWLVNGLNSRVEACNEVYRLLEVDMERYAYTPALISHVVRLMGMLAFGATLLFLSEITGKVYLPISLVILGYLAIMGSFSGLYQLNRIYLDMNLDITRYIRLLKYSSSYEYILALVLGVITLGLLLWSFFLAGRGDMSAKGQVFRFSWAKWLVLVGVIPCGALSTFEALFLFELHYDLSLPMALIAMGLGATVCFLVVRYLILRLGR